MESIFSDVIQGFTPLTDVFFLLREHVEIMHIRMNPHEIQSLARTRVGRFDRAEQRAAVVVLYLQYYGMYSTSVQHYYSLYYQAHTYIQTEGKDKERVCVCVYLCMCVSMSTCSTRHQRETQVDTVIPPGACWVSLE